ncbi:hypothetical protein NUITMVK11_3430 (plasmid) [Klebsiella quasipneumoniae]|uniref:Uncharacterized protein n=1 Tax=Klebsiella quasipneumoniae TaxID=1463165 RepID=A0AB33INS0_9ENTR|nr:hypothetical protein NUITMVK11_3430 [Klebsiella quasipneumoniae]
MDEEMLFSLSYEQMTQMAEEEIKQCDFRRDGTHYVWEVNNGQHPSAILVVSPGAAWTHWPGHNTGRSRL